MADSTLELTKIRLIERAWYLSPQTSEFFDQNYLPVYYEIRGRYASANGITVNDFEVNFKDDKKFVDFLIDRIYIAYGTKSLTVYEEMVHSFRNWREYGVFPKPRSVFRIVLKMASDLLLTLGIIHGGQLTIGKQITFGCWIATLAEDKELLIKYSNDTNSVSNFMDVSLIPFFISPFKPAIALFDMSMRDSASAYRSIAESFEYKSQYKLTVIVDSKNEVETIVSILPDQNDKITFSTINIPEEADVNSILTIDISEYRTPDLPDMQKSTGTVVDVHDGDTFTLSDGTKIRILPINAPELNTPEGIISQNTLSNLILNKGIDYYIDPTNSIDVYGRTLAYVYRNGVDLGEWMMNNGYAVLYRLTNAWFQTEVVKVDEKYTYLTTITDFYDKEYLQFLLTYSVYKETNIRIPNYYMPFASELGDVVYLRITLSNKVSYKTYARCDTPEYVDLLIEPEKTDSIRVPLLFLEQYVASPCGKRIRASIRFYSVCYEDLSEGEVKSLYDRVEGGFAVFKVLDSENLPTSYEIKVPAGGETVTSVTTIIDDFETGNNTFPLWTKSGTLPWVSVGSAHSGKYAAGVIGNDSGSTYFYRDITVPSGGGTIEFYVKIGPATMQLLNLYVDGELKGMWSQNGWMLASISITEGIHEIRFYYQSLINAYNYIIIDDMVLKSSITTISKDYVPANITIGDYAIFSFKAILPYIVFNSIVDSVNSPWVTLKETKQIVPLYFVFPTSLIPFTIVAGDKIGIEIGKNIGDYYVADFHARLGNNNSGLANFIKMPEETGDLPINIPLQIVEDIVQDPAGFLDINKLQVGDMAYFKIIDKDFINSFKARLDRIMGANGIWKILPDEHSEIPIPSIVAEEFLTTKKYAEYPVCTISLRPLKADSIYDAKQEFEILSTDANLTVFKFMHVKFGYVQATILTNLFSWIPAAGDIGIFSMSYYSGATSSSWYVDSISASEAKLIHITKRVIIHYPIDKLPAYMKRFDVVRLQIKQRGFNADPLWMFVIIKAMDNGYGYAITQRTDNQAYVDIPVEVLPADAEEGEDINLLVSLYGYRETYFTARFYQLTLPETCTMLVEPDYYTQFDIQLNLLPGSAIINSVVGFKFTKMTAMDTWEPAHEITAITATDITLKKLSDNKTFTLPRTLLPYVTLPAPDNDIINLVVGDKFRLATLKIS